jgi:F0F1-type ATP synthase membrane subunit b/b'
MMKDATKRITEESARARRKLEAEVVDLVIEATEVVAGEKLDAKKDAKLLESALKGQV